ncbi:MAG: AzlD domain-containing protein [Anaerolineales bacterium]|jgi:branched-subunit amino acid transport protein
MNAAQIWALIVGGMFITYTLRTLFILVFPPERLPGSIRNALRYVPPAVLAALIFPEVLLQQGHLSLTWSNDRLVAALAASVIAWRTKSTWLTILAGMLILGLLTGWGG